MSTRKASHAGGTGPAALQKARHIFRQGLELEKQGKPGLAEKKYRKSLALYPKLAEAHNRLGNVLAARKQWKAAEQSYRRALRQSPGDPVLLTNIGNVLYLQENYREAESVLQQALGTDPEHALANNTMGNVLMKLRRLDDAAACFAAASRQMPAAPEIATNLGSVLCRQEKYEQAIPLLQETIEKHPRFADAYLELASALYNRHGPQQAIMLLDEAMSLLPDNPALHALAAEIFCREGRLTEAREAIDRALRTMPEKQDYQLILGEILRKQNKTEESIRVLRVALALDRQNPKACCSLGLALEAGNLKTDARQAYREAVRLDPEHVQANCRLLRDAENSELASDSGRIEALLDSAQLKDDEKAVLLNALGKSCEVQGDYDRAFEYIRNGNDLKASRNPYDVKAREKRLETIRSIFTEDYLLQYRDAGCSDIAPIFITGMPRSGKTLLETVLGLHPDIIPGGESSDFILAANTALAGISGSLYPDGLKDTADPPFAAIGKDYAARLQQGFRSVSGVTNTHPSSADYLGMIRCCLPKARMIVCRRDAKDTCTEIYTKHFDNGHYYSLKFDTLSGYYRLQDDLLDYWAQLLPGQVLFVQFEELIHEPRRVMNAVLEFCRLPADRSLSPDEIVPPAERVIGVWKRYQSQLAPMFAALEAGRHDN